MRDIEQLDRKGLQKYEYIKGGNLPHYQQAEDKIEQRVRELKEI